MDIKLDKQSDGRNFILLDGVPTALAFTDELITDLNNTHRIDVKLEMLKLCEHELKSCGDPRLTDDVVKEILILIGGRIDECLS